MEESFVHERPRLPRWLSGIFVRHEETEESQDLPQYGSDGASVRPTYRNTVTVRTEVVSFEDAIAAAHGLRRGEMQILNLTNTDSSIRQKIVDFMSGVNFAEEGTWEKVGEDIYLVSPAQTYVEVAPPTPRMQTIRN